MNQTFDYQAAFYRELSEALRKQHKEKKAQKTPWMVLHQQALRKLVSALGLGVFVLGVHGRSPGLLLCGESSPRPPDNRAAAMKQKWGDPDRVIHERERYQLTIDTPPEFA